MKSLKMLFSISLMVALFGTACNLFKDDDEEEVQTMKLTLIDDVESANTKKDDNAIILTSNESGKYVIADADAGFYKDSIPADTEGYSFAGWYDDNNKLYTSKILAEGFTHNKDEAVTLYARYNDIKSEQNAVTGNLYVYKPETKDLKIIDKQYNYADYTAIGKGTEKICGILLYNDKDEQKKLYTDTDGTKTSSVESATHLILGVSVGSGLAWRRTDSFLTSTLANIGKLEKSQDKTGYKNNALAATLFDDVLEAFDWADKYTSTYELPSALTKLTWYLPSEIEFDTYIAGNLSDYLNIIGISSRSGADFWTASLDKLSDSKYLACYYSAATKNFAAASPSEKKYALAVCQYAY